MLGFKDNSDITTLIEDLELRLKTCNYTDEYGKIISDKIQELKQLIKEPIIHSLKNNKNEPSNDTQTVEQLKQLLTKF